MTKTPNEPPTQADIELDFNAEYTSNLPAILAHLNISFAFTSYQAGRVIFARSKDGKLDINYKSFERPMGLVATETGLTLGTFTQIIHFQREDALVEKLKQPLERVQDDITAPKLKANQDQQTDTQLNDKSETDTINEPENIYLASQYKPVDEAVDACYITRSSHYTGMINIHDIDWGHDGLWAVNSSFSCLSTIQPDSSFVPRWKPYFISELAAEDRCHLNGMALKDGKPAFVTTFSKFNEKAQWRNQEKFDGTLMDVVENKILLDGLCMPHSPRFYQGKVYYCNSGLGQVCCYDPQTKSNTVIAELPGFTRGIDFYGAIMFVGLSKVRQSDVSRPAPIAQKHENTSSGVWLLNLEDNTIVATLSFTGNVDQLYDIAVLKNTKFPELIEPNHPRMRNHFCFNEFKPL
ncbi:TIGR03032 family protein [Catenovulum adriaticum]|uniref:TIGR03032 family protein n=1 Tax=Catenovulum adriaticum TaxID=2984846 RepID=A0ABY7ASD0_9ALTE|nr:TIGR03032 family protein [Catenovulum sp. TS8]WAJ71410.1 TIGR03032 family protein [Catenovulum sp. TS8]